MKKITIAFLLLLFARLSIGQNSRGSHATANKNGKSVKPAVHPGTAAHKKAPASTFKKPVNGIYAPRNEELSAIRVRYKDVTLDKLKEGYSIFKEGPCIKCHGAQNIYKRGEIEWRDIIEIMAEKAKISDTQKDAVYKYILAIKATQPKKAR